MDENNSNQNKNVFDPKSGQAELPVVTRGLRYFMISSI